MSELALKLIAEAKEKRLTHLDLGNCGLTEIPEEVFELIWLKELSLSNEKKASSLNDEQDKKSKNQGENNLLSEIPQSFMKLKQLEKLTLAGGLNSNWKISNIDPLSVLKKLVELDLSNNLISNISPLSSLVMLTKLNLGNNQISSISPLSSLENLINLGLSSNQIISISSLKLLTKLECLNFQNNQVVDIRVLSSLLNLTGLVFIENKISDISPLSTLTKLTSLSSWNNQISDIESLATLTKLKYLYLWDNQIRDISALATLVELKCLYLWDNQISDITPLVIIMQKGVRVKLGDRIIAPPNFLSEEGIFIEGNPLINPPSEVIEQGNPAILSYFKDLEQQGEAKLNEAKLIIVGEPEAGKTTLMEMLLDPKYQLSDTKSTLGIEVRQWKFPHPDKDKINTSFTANIWDFGGQQIQYMTHQFFLTPSAAYVLVSANDRKESVNFPYWFKIIHLLGEEQGRYSPVLVVLNEKNDEFVNKLFDLNAYQELYPELDIKICRVDLSQRDGKFLALEETIQQQLTQLSHVTDDRPARWNDIRSSLQILAKDKDHISFSEYASVCEQHEVNNETSQMVLSGYLHRLGSLLHFADDLALRDFIILNPQWAVDAVYGVLADKEISDNDGYFTQEKLDTIWKDYSLVERGHLLSLMKQENFEICYALEGEVKGNTTTYIAPQLLNERQPHYEWGNDENTNSLKFRFRYKFMPKGVITRLVVRMNHLIAKGEDEECGLVWRKGVVLKQNGCLAQIKEEEKRDGLKIIDIAVIGDVNKRKFLLHSIRDQVQEIHKKWFRNIQVEQMIPCNCGVCKTSVEPTYFEYSELEQYQNEGISDINCRNGKVKRVKVMPLLEGVFDEREIRKSSRRLGEADLRTPDVHIHNHVTANVTPLVEDKKTPQDNPALEAKKEEQQAPSPWYKEWWVISLIIGVAVGLTTGLAFLSLKIGAITALLAGVIVYFHNPKRRFFRVGVYLLFLFGAIVTPPLISGYVKSSNPENVNGVLEFALKIGESMNPWLAGGMALITLAGAITLFVLDHKQQ